MLKKYEKFIYNIILSKNKKRIVLLITLALFVLSIAMIPTELVKAKMLPGKNSNYFSVYLNMSEGTSKVKTYESAVCVNDILIKEKNVENIEIFLGNGAPLDFAGLIKGSAFKNSENTAELIVNLIDKHERNEPSYLMVQRLRTIVKNKCQFGNDNISFVEQPSGPPVLASIVAEIYGEDTEELSSIANFVSEVFDNTDGLVDVEVLEDDFYETYNFKIKSVKANNSGISIEQINQMLFLHFEGMKIGFLNDIGVNQQIPVFIRLNNDSRRINNSSLEEIENKLSSIFLLNPQGVKISLLSLIEIVPSNNVKKITNKNLKQVVKVLAETDMVSQVYPLIEAKNTIIKTFNSKYIIEEVGLFNLKLTNKETLMSFDLVWDGEMKVTIDTFIDLGGAFIAALILIFLLMVVYYKNFVFSGIVLLGSFLSIIGVIFGHFVVDLFTSDTFFLTATSLIGFIALIGISSRNSLLLIDFTKQLSSHHDCHNKTIAISSATRAKPIFLTAAAIILASTLLAGDAVFGGLGISLIFGTVAAVFASLFVVPVLLSNSNLNKYFKQ